MTDTTDPRPIRSHSSSTPSPALERIRVLLAENSVEFREVRHEPTRTSEESARARGESVEIGGKALLMKTGDEFRLFVLSAARKLDSAAIRERFGAKKARFATPEELLELTGLVPGSVPPFGRPILPFDLFVDESIARNEKIAFNAGSITDSIIMPTHDYLRVAKPTETFRFSLAAG
ncbi:MAG TPA: YbaK/EbsC family protein [Phycisphaerae bacterium]|nr:YbaK/EbsC family protein [Phycisphaerae bacterium]